MKIPVFHDDQHGTAIIVGAAVLNGLKVVGKDIEDVKLVCSGAGAAASLPRPAGEPGPAGARTSSSPTARAWSTRAASRAWTRTRRAMRSKTPARTLAEVIAGADIFLGLSAGRRASRNGS